MSVAPLHVLLDAHGSSMTRSGHTEVPKSGP
jgi:hypothetical protein